MRANHLSTAVEAVTLLAGEPLVVVLSFEYPRHP